MTKDYGFHFEHSIVTTEGNNVANHLLRELMEAMGESDHARAQTPREVWNELLSRIRDWGVQIPSEANGERLINERLSDVNADGWRVAQMMDHNGLLVCLLEREEAT